MAALSCPWCNAPRADAPSCPKCGANYAKAEAIKTQGRAAAGPTQVVPEEEKIVVTIAGGIEDQVVEDPKLEFKLCVAAIPAMLALGVLFHYLTPGMQRIAFGMPLHELGHATSAWFTGFWAIPTLWKTIIPDERGLIAPVLLAGALGFMIWRAWMAQKTYLVVLGALLLGVQALGTFYLGLGTAIAVYTFGGDGIGMVLATALMCTFFFGKRTQLYKGSLRWGFVAIGAAAFSDMFATWWTAYRDPGTIPVGEIEGVGLSDSARLLAEHFWTERQLVNRFMAVGVSCLVALALVYAWGVRLAWRKAQEAEKAGG